MSEWLFDKYEVLVDGDGFWWHVTERLEDTDSNVRRYKLWDATHTDSQYIHAEDVEGSGRYRLYWATGWSTTTKPAAERGFRVNGVLTGPGNIEYWLGRECSHSAVCPNCGEDGSHAIDIIHSHEDQEVVWSEYRCRECGETWRVDR